MARKNKAKYSTKQKRKADNVADSYERHGASQCLAKWRAWATINKKSGGGKNSSDDRSKTETCETSEKGGQKGLTATRSRGAADRSASAKRSAEFGARNAGGATE
jgi:hypothetical protein